MIALTVISITAFCPVIAYAQSGGLQVISSRLLHDRLVGEIKNNNEYAVSGVQIEPVLYDSQGRIIRPGYSYPNPLSGVMGAKTLNPGESSGFQALCPCDVNVENYEFFMSWKETLAKPTKLKIGAIGSLNDVGVYNIDGNVTNIGDEPTSGINAVAVFYNSTNQIVRVSGGLISYANWLLDKGATEQFHIEVPNGRDITHYSLNVQSREYAMLDDRMQDATVQVDTHVVHALGYAVYDNAKYAIASKSNSTKIFEVDIKPEHFLTLNLACVYSTCTEPDEVELVLPKDLIDGITTVRTGEQDIGFEKIEENDSYTTIRFTIPAETSSIDVYGAELIPEFGSLALIVTAVSAAGLILWARSARNKTVFR